MSKDTIQTKPIKEIGFPSTDGMTTKVVKGSIWTLAGQIAPLAVSLAATPFTIRFLGPEGYGVFILVSLIPTYLAFADFGMSVASTRFASEAFASGEIEKEGQIVRSAVVITLAALIPSTLLLFSLSGEVITFFGVSLKYQGEASTALKLASIVFVFTTLCSVLNTPQLVRLRMDLNSLVNSVPRVISLVLTPTILYFGFGIVGALCGLVITSFLNLVGHMYVSRRLLPVLFDPTFDRENVRPLIRFGSGMVFGAVAGIALVNAEKGVLAATVSTEALAHYSVAFTLANMLTLFSVSMIQSLIPAFSQLQGQDKQAELITLFSRCIRLSLIWAIPAVVFLGLIGKTFFTIWAGREFGVESTLPLYLLLLGLAANILAWIPYTAIMAAGRPDILAKLYWLELPPYVLLVWLLASRYGAAGAAAAWTIRVVLDAYIQFALARRVGGISNVSVKPRVILSAAATMLFPFCVYLIYGNLGPLVIGLATICFGFYVLIVWFWYLDKDESRWLWGSLRSRFFFG